MNTDMNENATNYDPRNPATPEEIWTLLRETDQILKGIARKQEETDRQMQETSRLVGRLTNSFGELAEHLVAPNIREKFRAMGYRFENTSYRMKIGDGNGRTAAEVDIWLENGDYVMAVEVKSRLTGERIDRHIDRIGRIRERFDEKGDRRKILGAVAGAIFDKESRDYAVSKGLYAIGQSGGTVFIDVPEGFNPREW